MLEAFAKFQISNNNINHRLDGLNRLKLLKSEKSLEFIFKFSVMK